MFNRLLNIACACDWLTPTFAFLQDAYYYPMCDFGIPSSQFWNRSWIKRLLSKNSIKVWGLMYNLEGDVLMFSVQKKDAMITYLLLQWIGIPIIYAPAEAIQWSFQD